MIELWVIALRGVQYVAIAIALGLPAFMLYNPAVRAMALVWPRRMVLAAALVLLVAAPAALVAQTAMMAGSLEAALNPDALGAVISLPLGMAILLRAVGAALLVVVLATFRPERALWLAAAVIAALVNATFVWTSHAGATGFLPLLLSDVVHLLAASIWIGALAAFAGILFWRSDESSARLWPLITALAGFARVGTLAVVLLIGTGLVNGVMLIGFENVLTLAETPYGQTLIAKLALFAMMLALAGANRFRLAPALAAVGKDATDTRLRMLRLSIGLELAAGVTLLALVAVLGTLPPPS